MSLLKWTRQIVWQQRELKFLIKRTRKLLNMPGQKAMAAHTLTTSVLEQQVMHMEQQ